LENNILSVIVCTYNPNLEILNRVILSLKSQTLQSEHWELIVIDNNSTEPLDTKLDLNWHPNSKIIIEKNQGLALARIRGVKESANEFIVFIDDDNVANNEYLNNSLQLFTKYESVGLFGGKALPNYLEHTPADWIKGYIGLLGCRDLGEKELISTIEDKKVDEYPYFSPIGTGMCIRKKVFLTYLNEIENSNFRKNLGRKGAALTSGEDNDIVITALKSGWQVGYFPQLLIEHIIPEKRTTKEYLGKMNQAQNKSWIQLLLFHAICPWSQIPKWSVPLRKSKAFFTYKAWTNQEAFIKWKGACGLYEGLGIEITKESYFFSI